MIKKRKPKTTLQTVERALSFLEFVAEAETPPNLRDVASGLKLNIATAYHLFNTLQARGYVARGGDGGVRLGQAAAVLYQAMADHLVHGQAIRRIIEQLSTATQETVYLTRLAGASVVIKSIVEAAQTLRVSGLRVGFSGKEHLRASGKAVLAHLPDEKLTVFLKDIRPALNERERKNLLEELAAIRRRGVAIDDETYDRGICCVAAPYFRADGMVAGSVTVSLPAVRFPKASKRLATAVLEAADAVSNALSHTTGDAAAGEGEEGVGGARSKGR